MHSSPVVLLGLGFTTGRLARRLLARNMRVFAVVRRPERFPEYAEAGVSLIEHGHPVPVDGAIAVHTIPPIPHGDNQALRDYIAGLPLRRLIYISSTSVYGENKYVDFHTPVAPSEEKGLRRVEEEHWLQSQSWSSLVIRPAAIYGPGRGVHVRIREGRPPRVAGGVVVSRIHVDDLAASLDAAVDSNLEGAWPIADDYACSTDEITHWCEALFGKSGKPQTVEGPAGGRIVNGQNLRLALGIQLRYPTYREGIPACIAEEPPS